MKRYLLTLLLLPTLGTDTASADRVWPKWALVVGKEARYLGDRETHSFQVPGGWTCKVSDAHIPSPANAGRFVRRVDCDSKAPDRFITLLVGCMIRDGRVHGGEADFAIGGRRGKEASRVQVICDDALGMELSLRIYTLVE